MGFRTHSRIRLPRESRIGLALTIIRSDHCVPKPQWTDTDRYSANILARGDIFVVVLNCEDEFILCFSTSLTGLPTTGISRPVVGGK